MLQSYVLERAPKAGEKAWLGNSEVAFLSPGYVMPAPNEQSMMMIHRCVLSQNADYMDIGAEDIDHGVIDTVRAVLYVMLTLALMIGLQDISLERSYFVLKFFGLLSVFHLTLVMGYYILRRRRRTTVRYYRKRQVVAFKPSRSAKVVEIPWRELVAYIQAQRILGAAGNKTVSLDGCGLKLAWYDAETKTLHTFYHAAPFLFIDFSMDEWLLIQRYMHAGDEDCHGNDEIFASKYEPVPSSASFKAKRQRLWEAFRANNNKRLFSFDLHNMSGSYLTMALYYLAMILGLWRLPYLFCDLYLALAVKPFLPKNPLGNEASCVTGEEKIKPPNIKL
ncbi:hypothetical protein [Shewanella algae]|uniref:hypothetical protein n=1 Tax=Shewanella algae TaxID=38313 RepID=UPI0031F5B4D9